MALNQEKVEYLKENLPELRLRAEENLAAHTSFRIGGAAAMAFPKSEEELGALLRLCKQTGISIRLLGAGTNVLAPDEGVDDLVICMKDALMGIKLLDETHIEAYAGESLARVAVFAREHSLSGLECLHGIPGSVGGAVYMNAGAYGGEISQICEKTVAFSLEGEKTVYSGAEQKFGYRQSVFEENGAIVVKAVFALHPGKKEEIAAKMAELMARRRASQPLELPSAGSTFKRPEGHFAGTLIEGAGLKGKGAGGAEVSEKHAGFIVNRGGATAADVKATISLVQKTVLEQSGVALQPEVRIW